MDLFHEVYSAYFRAMEQLLPIAMAGTLTEKNATEIIGNSAFEESFLSILENIKTEQWQLITKNFTTPLRHEPKAPFTSLEKQFLKALTLDPRFRLFYPDPLPALEGIEPLYTKEDFYYFDQLSDGDSFTDPAYIQTMHTVLRGLKEKKRLDIIFRGGKGTIQRGIFTPKKLEYSQKDDKFRLLCLNNSVFSTINLARIQNCQLYQPINKKNTRPLTRKTARITVHLVDERNALERAMLHFSNFQKETRHIEKNRYEMILQYYKDDETELLIRMLSFGPMVKVVSPKSFVSLITKRLERQKTCMTEP